jgi:hypothetical protein
MSVIWVRNTLGLVVMLAGVLLLKPGDVHAQTVDVTRWFQMGNSEIDERANGAVDHLSLGMSDIILALNGGRKRNIPVDADIADRAISEIEAAGKEFQALGSRLKGHSIDLATIRNYGAERQYYDLMVMLDQNGYREPNDWGSYTTLLMAITDRVVADLRILRDNPKNMPILQRAFFDLISQKILLEKIGTMSGVITISML